MKKVNFNVLQSITDLAKKMEEQKLIPKNMSTKNASVRKLAKFLNLNEQQLLLFVAIFISQNERFGEANVKSISSFLNKSFFDILAMKSDFDELMSRRYIYEVENFGNRKRRKNFSRMEFEVNEDILSAIYENEPIQDLDAKTDLDVFGFVARVSDLIEDRTDERINTTELLMAVRMMENQNCELPLINQLELIGIENDDRLFIYEMCDDFIKGSGTDVSITLSRIFDHPRKRFAKAREWKEKRGKLFELELVRTGDSNFMNDFRLYLGNKGLELFLQEDAALYLGKQKNKNLLTPDRIKAKNLFYESDTKSQVEFLVNSLVEDRYNELCTRLHENKLPQGINCIFYGAPGTGKTETAYQIAKTTGRAVYMVDISSTKSMWFGESEKTICEIFVKYRSLCKSAEVKPILLFNEADAVFGKRKEGNASNVAQTENAIQNIILEEMERLDGIMIATTNLAENFDTAFDRRFLFKVKFEKPSAEAKKLIWKDRLNWLDDETALKLAHNYDFSGGEIENIVRKAVTHEVLNGTKPDADLLSQFCRTEKISTKSQRNIVGF